MRLDLWFLVPGADGRTILTTADGRLPTAQVDGGEETVAAVGPADTYLRSMWRCSAAILETHPKAEAVADGEPVPTLVTTDRVPSDWLAPDGLVFQPMRADPGQLPAALQPRAAELLAELLAGAPPPPLRPRWARPGWFDRASGWMGDAAAHAGRPLTGEPRPFFLRGISALLRAPTAGPDLFLKAVFPLFHAEPILTRLLAERFPDQIPPVVAVQADEGWLIVEDIGADWIGEVPKEDRPAALRRGSAALVSIQRAFAADPSARRALLDAGGPYRPLSSLVDSVAAAIGPDGFGIGDHGLAPERAARLLEAIATAVARVESVGLPESVVHGDFHSGNAALVGDRIVIIDWSDAAIGSPAVDLVTWLAWSGDDAAELDAGIGGWVDAWSGIVDADRLRATLDDILIVGAAYQIVSYDGIRRNLEPATRYTMTGGGDHFLKELEKVLDRREASAPAPVATA
ncbi:MAG TPA: phosphotransferase [Candidatus Limnocylindrales bacterium]|nr:phosphotransferase [Candidatus Limnocylindrales bacterium]